VRQLSDIHQKSGASARKKAQRSWDESVVEPLRYDGGATDYRFRMAVDSTS